MARTALHFLVPMTVAALTAVALPSVALAQDDDDDAGMSAGGSLSASGIGAEADGDADADADVDGDGDGDGDGEDLADGAGALPVPYTQRPLTLPEMMVAPYFGFGVTNFDFGPLSATVLSVGLGGEFGVTDDFMVEAQPLSLVFGDVDLDYGTFMLGATYRFVKDPVQAGARLRLFINGGGTIGINPGLPVRIETADIVRIDTGLDATLAIPTGNNATFPALTNDTSFGLYSTTSDLGFIEPGIPLKAAFQIIDEAWAGLGTGFGVSDFSEFGDRIFVPLQFLLGATIPAEDGPLVDLNAGFGFPIFVNSFGGDTVSADVWQLGLSGKGYLQL